MFPSRLRQRTLPRVIRRHLSIFGKEYPSDSQSNVPPSILSRLPRRLYTRNGHPLCTIRALIANHFGPSFEQVSKPNPIVTPGQNFDDLSFPKNHPGRSKSDSYYVNRDYLLRTHTSAHELEVFGRGLNRWLLAADVYRRDEIDSSHYPVFHQMEGACSWVANANGIADLKTEIQYLEQALRETSIIIEDVPHITSTNPSQKEHDPIHSELVARHLKLSINALIFSLFATPSTSASVPLRVRWIEAYFPFTSPSYEVEVLFEGKWLEVLGCGVVLHRTFLNSNQAHKIGWAFGLGLERLAMVLFSIPDIRLFWSTDERFSRQFQQGKITTFKPYSRYPICFKDVSFWHKGIHENDVCDLIRDVAGDLVENVQKIDTYQHPRTLRESVCYRVSYRSMDR